MNKSLTKRKLLTMNLLPAIMTTNGSSQALSDGWTISIMLIMGCATLWLLIFAVIIIFRNKAMRHKNQQQMQQVMALDHTNLDTMNDKQLFQFFNDVIVRERLFLDPRFERHTIMKRFQLSKDRVGAAFSKGSKYPKISNYVQELRLEYAANLLLEQPAMSVVQVANESGFSSTTYFCKCFKQHYSMSPSDFRNSATKQVKV